MLAYQDNFTLSITTLVISDDYGQLNLLNLLFQFGQNTQNE